MQRVRSDNYHARPRGLDPQQKLHQTLGDRAAAVCDARRRPATTRPTMHGCVGLMTTYSGTPARSFCVFGFLWRKTAEYGRLEIVV